MNLEIRPHVRHSNPAPMFADAVGLPQLLLRRDAAGTSLMTRVSHARRPNCAGAAALLMGVTRPFLSVLCRRASLTVAELGFVRQES